MSNPADQVAIHPTPDGVQFALKAVPGASRTRIVGVWNDCLRLAVAAPPEAGKANREIERFLAETFGLKAGDVAVIAGLTNPRKRVRVRLEAAALRARLATLL